MNGPEHYREAERLIAQANKIQHDQGPGCGSDEVLAEAQVHATLALAAATALTPFANVDNGNPDSDVCAWREAAGTGGGS